jgi:hypothetical protein
MYAIAGKKWGIPIAGIDRGMKELEWHISKFCICNGISPNGESCNGISPINPFIYGHHIGC